MNTEEKIFTSADVAAVAGIDPDTTPRKQESYSAMNAVHFAIIRGLVDFGFTVPTAAGFASAIGVAASAVERSGMVVIRRQTPPATGSWVKDGDPIWVDLGTHEVAMYPDFYQFSFALADMSGVCLVLNVAGIESDVLAKMEAIATARSNA